MVTRRRRGPAPPAATVCAVVEVHDPHAGGVAALRGDVADRHADDGAARGDDEDLVVEADHEGRDHVALLGGELDAPHALAAAALAVELVELGALAVAGVGDDAGSRRRRGRRRRTRPRRSGLQLHAPHAGGRPAHGPHVVLGEADGHARLRLTMKMSSPPLVGMTRTSSSSSRRLMAMSPAAQRRVVLGELGLLHLALAGGEEQVPVRLVVAGVDDRLDRLVGLQRQQVDDGRAPRRAVLHRDLVGLEPVHPAPVGEEQQVGVGRGRVMMWVT